MTLKGAFELRRRDMVALIGAGGKTTTLFRLAKELFDDGDKVLVTTTTKIFKPTKPHIQRLFLVQEVLALLEESRSINRPAIIGAGYGIDDADKLLGLPAAWFEALQARGGFDWILIEADGAASRLFKIPSDLEPVIPESCSLTVWTMSVKALGKSLDAEHVHRPERAVSLLGLKGSTLITADHIVQLVKNPAGCFKGIPRHSRKIALLNQADSPEEIESARKLARALLPLGIERVVVTSYLNSEPVKDVIVS